MTKRNILLIDDEVDFAETMVQRLEMRGYNVTLVNTGEEGLERAKEKPDIILLDVMMPVMDGYEVCGRLRQNETTKNIPIIMLTAKNMSRDKVEGLQRGADDYLTKSFDLEELFARIEALLRRSGLLNEVEKDKALLMGELKRIIDHELVEMVYQPIFNLTPREITGYEVLCRTPRDSVLNNPEKLFKCALSYGLLFELEVLCRRKAMAKAGELAEGQTLFFNTSPCLIESGRFDEIIAAYDDPAKIVFEITEHSEIRDFEAFCNTLKGIKAKGFKVAIDDVGSGYSSLDTIAELEPDFAKINISIVKEINANPKRQSLVKAIMMICKEGGIVTVGEGIETEDELNTLISLGVDAGQGYFLGRPNPQLGVFK